jgi:hypothetical protein
MMRREWSPQAWCDLVVEIVKGFMVEHGKQEKNNSRKNQRTGESVKSPEGAGRLRKGKGGHR